MFLPPHIGEPRQPKNPAPLPDWFIRDMGERLYEYSPKRRWRLPIWPGFRLEIKLIHIKRAEHV